MSHARLIRVQLRREALEHAQVRQNLTSVDLAALLHISQSYLSSLKHGRNLPSPQLRRRFLKILDLGFDELFEVVPDGHGPPEGGSG